MRHEQAEEGAGGEGMLGSWQWGGGGHGAGFKGYLSLQPISGSCI